MSSEKYQPFDGDQATAPYSAPPQYTQQTPYPTQQYGGPTQPYIAQQGYGGPTQPYIAQQGYTNQTYHTGSTTVVTQPQQVVVTNYPYYNGGLHPDATSQIVFSCVVIWCCFMCLGIPAFILAILAMNEHDADTAYRKLRIANYLNIAGVIVGVCILITWVALVIAAIVHAANA